MLETSDPVEQLKINFDFYKLNQFKAVNINDLAL